MGLKQIINRNKILKQAIELPFELPGEPLPYSIRSPVGERKKTYQDLFRIKWKSLLKCLLPSYLKSHIPLVFLVRFYVSPPADIFLTKEQLKQENIPAVHTYELAEYWLFFQEMLHQVLFNSYRQVVKIEMDKFYSSNPRIVFQFLRWDHYATLHHKVTAYSPCQNFGATGKIWESLHAQQQAHKKGKRMRSVKLD